jgi:hypothetical protein
MSDEIAAAVNKACEKAREDGLWQGLQVAEYIFALWRVNHQLKAPHSPEQLIEWSERKIAEYKGR